MRKTKILAVIIASLFINGCALISTNEKDLGVIDESTLIKSSSINNTVSQDKTYDETKWELVTSQQLDIDGDNIKESALLLKTRAIDGYTGADDPEYGVRVVITKNETLIFDYSPSEDIKKEDMWPVGYYRPSYGEKSNFYVADLTGDKIEDLVLKTGVDGASDFSLCSLIFTYDRTDNKIKVVNKKDFCSSFNVGILLRDITNKINGYEILKAKPLNGIIGGNKITQSFVIEVWTWDGNRFSKFKEFQSTREYEGGGNAVEGEASQIERYFWSN